MESEKRSWVPPPGAGSPYYRPSGTPESTATTEAADAPEPAARTHAPTTAPAPVSITESTKTAPPQPETASPQADAPTRGVEESVDTPTAVSVPNPGELPPDYMHPAQRRNRAKGLAISALTIELISFFGFGLSTDFFTNFPLVLLVSQGIVSPVTLLLGICALGYARAGRHALNMGWVWLVAIVAFLIPAITMGYILVTIGRYVPFLALIPLVVVSIGGVSFSVPVAQRPEASLESADATD